MRTEKFSISEALKFGWAKLTENLGFLVGVMFFLLFVQIVPDFFLRLIKKDMPILYFVAKVLLGCVGIVIQLGWLKITLKLCDNKKSEFEDLFSSIPLFFRFLASTIIYGTLLFIPGFLFGAIFIFWVVVLRFYPLAIIQQQYGAIASSAYIFVAAMVVMSLSVLWIALLIKFQFYSYAIVDEGMGPIEALKRSSQITKGSGCDIFIFGTVVGLVNVLGIVCLFIGLLATAPMTAVAYAYVYRKLSLPAKDIAAVNRKTSE